MTISKDTKLADLMEAFPWLIDEIVKMEPSLKSKVKLINSPLGKAFLKKATIQDLSDRAGVSVSEILDTIKKAMDNHKQQSGS